MKTKKMELVIYVLNHNFETAYQCTKTPPSSFPFSMK